MKSIQFFTVAFFLMAAGCKPTAYFNSPNDLSEKECTISLMNGTELKGKLTVKFETGNSAFNSILLKTPDKGLTQIPVDSVKYYQIGKDLYFPKIINLESAEVTDRYNVNLPNERNILFLKRITGENAPIGMFELFKSRFNYADGNDHFDYFVSLKTMDRLNAVSIRGKAFFPDFDQKMSALVTDCPALAQKISHREKSYRLNQFSLELKKVEVFKRIISEYNSCR
jgi:hypothetical protein